MSRPKIFHLIHMAHRALFRAADRLLAERHDITAAQNALLLYLEKNEGATMGAVATAIGLKNAATSGLVDRMEGKGLIARRPSKHDRRSFELLLLPKGRAIAAASHAIIHATNDHLLEGFTEEEQETIARFLETVIARSDAYETGSVDLEEQQSA